MGGTDSFSYDGTFAPASDAGEFSNVRLYYSRLMDHACCYSVEIGWAWRSEDKTNWCAAPSPLQEFDLK